MPHGQAGVRAGAHPKRKRLGKRVVLKSDGRHIIYFTPKKPAPAPSG